MFSYKDKTLPVDICNIPVIVSIKLLYSCWIFMMLKRQPNWVGTCWKQQTTVTRLRALVSIDYQTLDREIIFYRFSSGSVIYKK